MWISHLLTWLFFFFCFSSTLSFSAALLLLSSLFRPDGHNLCVCQFPHPRSITAVGCVLACVFFSSQIREELKLTSISAARLAFISSAGVCVERNRKTWKSRRVLGEIKERARGGERKKTLLLSVLTFILCLLNFFPFFLVHFPFLVRRSWVIKTPTFPTRGNKSN